jgi:hypothetical protein
MTDNEKYKRDESRVSANQPQRHPFVLEYGILLLSPRTLAYERMLYGRADA